MLKSIIESLELSFDFLNSQLFSNELPQVVITIQTKGNTKSKGWCTCNPVWYNDKEETFYEINFSAEHIDESYYSIMDTMIHEMCHLHNIIRDIKDCNKQQYHNKHFKEECDSVRLLVNYDKKYGYADTSLSEELKVIVDTIPIAKEVFSIARLERPIRKSNDKPKKIKMVCPICKSKVTSDNELDIICEQCNEKFIVVGK